MSSALSGGSLQIALTSKRSAAGSKSTQVIRCQASPVKRVPGILQKTGGILAGCAAALVLTATPLPVLAEGLDLASAAPAAGLLLDAAPLSTNDLIEKLNTNILPKIRQQITDLSRTADSNQATEDLKKQLQQVEGNIGKLLDDVQAGKNDLIPNDAGELQQGFDSIKKSLPNFS